MNRLLQWFSFTQGMFRALGVTPLFSPLFFIVWKVYISHIMFCICIKQDYCCYAWKHPKLTLEEDCLVILTIMDLAAFIQVVDDSELFSSQQMTAIMVMNIKGFYCTSLHPFLMTWSNILGFNRFWENWSKNVNMVSLLEKKKVKLFETNGVVTSVSVRDQFHQITILSRFQVVSSRMERWQVQHHTEWTLTEHCVNKWKRTHLLDSLLFVWIHFFFWQQKTQKEQKMEREEEGEI